MFFFRRTTLIDRIHTFLKGKIVKTPKNAKQITRNWQFTLINGKINVYGERRLALGDMNQLAEITTPNFATILVRYKSNISTADLDLLTDLLKNWASNKVVKVEPMFKVDVDMLVA